MCLTIVLHADDFGLNRAVSQGILRGFTHGLLTSTSVLANAPYAAQALSAWNDFARRLPQQTAPSAGLRHELDEPCRAFDCGVHLNLTQGRPLSGDRYPAELLDRRGCFPGVFSLFARLARRPRDHFAAALHTELSAQVERVVDHGVRPTHLNGHQYIELLPAVAPLLPELLTRFAIPVVRIGHEPALARTTLGQGFRLRAWLLAIVKQRYARRLACGALAHVAAAPDVFFGTAHAGLVNVRTIERFLDAAGRDRFVEIGLHPGHEDAGIRLDETSAGWHDPLSAHRPRELAMLESPLLAERLRSRGVKLGRLTDLVRTRIATAA